MAKGLFGIALEDLDTPEVGDVTETSLNAVEGGQELADDCRVIDEQVVAVEDAIEADGQLEDTADVLQSAVDSGEGVPESTARMTEVAVESIMLKLEAVGFGKKVVPSCESFGSTNTRLQQTRIALEGVWETIKSIWQKIKDTVKMIWTKISEFFSKFFSNAEKLEKAAKALEEEVGKAASFTQKEAKFKNTGLAKAFNVGGKVGPAEVNTVLNNHEKLVAGADKIFGTMTGIINELMGLANAKAKYEINLTVLKDLGEHFENFIGVKELSSKDENGSVVTSYGPYIGNRVLVTKATKLADAGQGISSLTIEFEDQEGKVAEDVPTLSNSEMKETCVKVAALAKSVVAYKKEQKRIADVGAGLSKVADGIMSATTKVHGGENDDAEVKKTLAAAKDAAKSVISMTSRMSTLAPSTAVSAGNSALAYVRASLKQYEEKKAA